jgi:hypothetical protein
MKKSWIVTVLLNLLLSTFLHADNCKLGTLSDVDQNACTIGGVGFQFGMLSFGVIDGRSVPPGPSMAKPLDLGMIRFEPHDDDGHVGFTLSGFPNATVTTAYTHQLVWLFLPLIIQPDSTSSIIGGDITANYINSVYTEFGSTATASGTLSVPGYVYAETTSGHGFTTVLYQWNASPFTLQKLPGQPVSLQLDMEEIAQVDGSLDHGRASATVGYTSLTIDYTVAAAPIPELPTALLLLSAFPLALRPWDRSKEN